LVDIARLSDAYLLLLSHFSVNLLIDFADPEQKNKHDDKQETHGDEPNRTSTTDLVHVRLNHPLVFFFLVVNYYLFLIVLHPDDVSK
jgi:hypothetical protein